MTIAWPNKQPEPDALPSAVTGPDGMVFEDCVTVAAVEAHIRELGKQVVEHARFPKRVAQHRADQDALLERRQLLLLEQWLSPA